jgi:hypothetical protein
MESDDLRLKVALLEKDLSHMTEKVDKMSEQVAELHEIMTQARGARWAILSVVAIGGFIAGKVGALSTIFGIK